MSEMKVECPSGLVGFVRGMKTKEANLLTDRQALRSGSAADSVLSNCWLRTEEIGPYAERFGPDGRPDWSKAHIGDRLHTLIRVRVATFGEEYVFPVNCPERACRERFDWEVNLSDLIVKPMPEDAREALRGTGILTADLDGRTIRFRLMTGADEVRAARQSKTNRTRLLVVSLNARIVGIEGVERADQTKHLDEMELADANRLLALLDEKDGGVETNIEVECPHCGATSDIPLPFGRGFLMPRVKATTTT